MPFRLMVKKKKKFYFSKFIKKKEFLLRYGFFKNIILI
jgi:hypothetical protein